MIYKGEVKLYAENDFPFWRYINEETFGLTDIFLGTRRNGTAISLAESFVYKL